MAEKKRLRELDFLRGVSILLILVKHQHLFTFTNNMGWIAVDLFFVLSGFLVSGLLFKEYLKFGDINPKKFLIRRGFKIYPVYYLFYIPFLIPILFNGRWNAFLFLSDMTFLQNYANPNGLGWANGASWSLAVEEHFYFGFTILLWLVLRYNKTAFKKNDTSNPGIGSFEITIILVMILCLVTRIYSNWNNNLVLTEQSYRNYTMSHLRIDSLLAGVFVSYLYYFRPNKLRRIFYSYKFLLFLIAFTGIIWTPFVPAFTAFFMMTFGFTAVFISFGILLTYFLLSDNINETLNKVFSTRLVNLVTKIGFCSYSIYIIHLFVIDSLQYILVEHNITSNRFYIFPVSAFLSISFGMIMTYKVEQYFLAIRDKYYPARVRFEKSEEVKSVNISGKI